MEGTAKLFQSQTISISNPFLASFLILFLDSAANAIDAHAASGDTLTRLTGMTLDEAQKILNLEEKGKTVTKEYIQEVCVDGDNYRGILLTRAQLSRKSIL